MADIDRDEILRIAELAHLALTDTEVSDMTTELGAIVAYVHQLQEVDIEGVPPTTHALIEALPLRADEASPSLDRDLVLSQAPGAGEDCFAVAAFVDEG